MKTPRCSRFCAISAAIALCIHGSATAAIASRKRPRRRNASSRYWRSSSPSRPPPAIFRSRRSCASFNSRNAAPTARPSCARRDALAPQLLGGEVGALPHRLELLPDDGAVHLGVVQGLRGEAAIGASDDVLAADQAGEADDALGDQFGMLDNVAGVRDDAGNQDFAFRHL